MCRSSTTIISLPDSPVRIRVGSSATQVLFFDSNPGVVLRLRRLNELRDRKKKKDIDSVKTIISDAFQQEIYKNGLSLFEFIHEAMKVRDRYRSLLRKAANEVNEVAATQQSVDDIDIPPAA